jgi:hypothetical protein
MRKQAWYALLLLPFVALLLPQLYNRADPPLFGLPFFYWYQLLWIIVTTVLLSVVVFATWEKDDV